MGFLINVCIVFFQFGKNKEPFYFSAPPFFFNYMSIRLFEVSLYFTDVLFPFFFFLFPYFLLRVAGFVSWSLLIFLLQTALGTLCPLRKYSILALWTVCGLSSLMWVVCLHCLCSLLLFWIHLFTHMLCSVLCRVL